MVEVKINATETVYYQAVRKMPQADLDELVEMLKETPHSLDIGDLPIDISDATNGEIDPEDVELNIKVDGKWKYVPLT
jgi:hypothetical protein